MGTQISYVLQDHTWCGCWMVYNGNNMRHLTVPCAGYVCASFSFLPYPLKRQDGRRLRVTIRVTSNLLLCYCYRCCCYYCRHRHTITTSLTAVENEQHLYHTAAIHNQLSMYHMHVSCDPPPPHYCFRPPEQLSECLCLHNTTNPHNNERDRVSGEAREGAPYAGR